MKNVTILNDLNTLNKLHTSSVESHTTNNGIVDFTCGNAGYVDNVVIEGKTLVNLIRTNLSVEVWDNNRVAINLQDCNYLEGTYTLFNFSDKTIVLDIGEATTNTWLRTFALDKNKVKTFNINNGERIFNINGLFADRWENNDASKNEFRNSIVLLEGDHTDKPISYFAGLKSAGQGDKIEVLSYKRGSENLASNLTFTEGKYVVSIDGGIGNNVEFKHSNEYIEVEGGCEYLFDNINGQFAIYDSSKNVIPTSWVEIQDSWFKGDNYQSSFIYAMPKNAKYVRINLPISNLRPYSLIKTKSDKKQIPVTLRSLPNGVKDTIEKRGNKYVKVQRCGESVISPDLIQDNDSHVAEFSNVARLGCYLKANFNNKTGDIVCLSDKFNYIADYELDKEHFYISNTGTQTNFFLFLNKSKLSGFDLNGFKNYLKENPLTVVYELKTPIITELPNFNPQTYKGDNTLFINSGVIQCDASFDVCEGIRSELDVIKNKVSSLDDTTTTIKYRNLRDDITFLNGWNIWGNEARFNCYVADNIVKICILLKPSVLTRYTPIFKLPAQYITGRKEFITCVDNNMKCYMGSLDETCMFAFEHDISSEAKYVAINFTYPLIKKVI